MTYPRVEVEMRGHRPHRIKYRGRWLRFVAVVDAWVDQHRWWATEERRDCVRAVVGGTGASPPLTLDLFRRKGDWFLVRVHD